MIQTIFSIFSDRATADSAIQDLKKEGYNTHDMSVIMKDTTSSNQVVTSPAADAAGGAVAGATTGTALGALAGLLIGIGAITVPGIGALLIGGPVAVALGLTGAAAATVSGAVTGALAGGVVGMLVNLGIPSEQAQLYEQRVREGAVVLIVPAEAGLEGQAINILSSHGAEQIRVVPMRT